MGGKKCSVHIINYRVFEEHGQVSAHERCSPTGVVHLIRGSTVLIIAYML